MLQNEYHNEWSGHLFFTLDEGSLSEPEKIVITAYDFNLMDIGSPGYTSFENDENEIIDLYEAHPEFYGMRLGMIHSHNTMDTYFSGEDINELYDNSKGTDFYLSMIVNAKGEFIARLSFYGERTIKTNSKSIFTDVNGNLIQRDSENILKQKTLNNIPLDVQDPFEKDDVFKELYDKVQKLREYNKKNPQRKRGINEFGNVVPYEKAANKRDFDKKSDNVEIGRQLPMFANYSAIDHSETGIVDTYGVVSMNDFLCKWLTIDMTYEKSFTKAFEEVQKATSQMEQVYYEYLFENFSIFFKNYFDSVPDEDDHVECFEYLAEELERRLNTKVEEKFMKKMIFVLNERIIDLIDEEEEEKEIKF